MSVILAANAYARLATRLDEASAGFWTDAERYAALSDGQRQVINEALAAYQALRKQNKYVVIPAVLREASKAATGTLAATTSSFALPSDYLDYLNFWYSPDTTTPKACSILDYTPNLPRMAKNSYLLGADTAYIDNGNLIVGYAALSTGGAYELNYVADPPDFSATQDGVLSERSMDAVVEFAFQNLLLKDQRTDESTVAGSRFKGTAGTLTS